MTLMVFPLSCLAFWAFGFAVGWGNLASGWRTALAIPDAILDRGLGIGPLTDDDGRPTGGYAYGLLGTKGFFLADIEPSGAGVSPALGSRDGRSSDGGRNGRTRDTGDASPRQCAGLVLLLHGLDRQGGDHTDRRDAGGAGGGRTSATYGLFIVLPFALAANWVWGGGWLARAGLNWRLGHGVVDFSGAGVIHALGGTIALVGAWLIGPRTGKYRNGRPQPLPGHHVPMVVLGSLIVACGWFAVNAGCGLCSGDISPSGVIVNTALAATAGTLASMLALGAKKMKPDPTLICNGMIAGLVAISGPCPFVDTWAAVVIGAAAGCMVVFSVLLLERRGIDDPAGAISVHGVAGLWGLLAVGIFANGRCGVLINGVQRDRFAVDGVRGLLYGDAGQLAAQAIGAVVLVAFGLVISWAWFQFANRCVPMRVSRDVELEGLDGPELGGVGLSRFCVTRHA